MHPTPHPLLLQLKGAPLSVLVALAQHGPQSCAQLSRSTGWWEGGVREALDRLVDLGLVRRRNYRTWVLSPTVTLDVLFSPTPDDAYEDEDDFYGPNLPTYMQTWADHASAETGSDHISELETLPHHTSAETRSHHVSTRETRPHHVSDTHLITLPPSQTRSRHASAPETRSHPLSEPYDDDLYISDHLDNHQSFTTPQILEQLYNLDPPFEDAAAWLSTVHPPLVAAWLQHLASLDRDTRRKIRNQSAFIRAKVASRQSPPPPRRRLPNGRPTRPPCPHCGKTYFDADNRCLICLGAITI